ncbi:MAG TPA: high-potential iron-sulfur protein [Burkholderiaceae bacterium]|nr:high-potential iron-sulfur protein [Burkholderiaceae bacterium]
MNDRRRSICIAVPLAALASSRVARALAQDARVAEGDPDAQAYAYRADVARVDAATSPKYKAGQSCRNCALFHEDSAGAAFGSCDLFLGREVAAGGWCNGWEAKSG